MEESFETNLKSLEQVVQELEKGDLTLDKALENFEKGIELSKKCNQKLDEAEKRINILVNKDGNVTEEEFIETQE